MLTVKLRANPLSLCAICRVPDTARPQYLGVVQLHFLNLTIPLAGFRSRWITPASCQAGAGLS